MKKFLSIAVILALTTCAAVFAAQDNKKQNEPAEPNWGEMPEMAGPVQQHQWLKKFVGDWTTDIELIAPGSEPIKESCTETVRAVGEFWIITDTRSKFMGEQYTAVLTLGYDPKKEKYIGTYVDSMTSQLWTYEGKLDESGNKLILNTEATMPDGASVKFRETHEIKSNDHRVFTSELIGPDGDFMEVLTVNAHRKKD